MSDQWRQDMRPPTYNCATLTIDRKLDLAKIGTLDNQPWPLCIHINLSFFFYAIFLLNLRAHEQQTNKRTD